MPSPRERATPSDRRAILTAVRIYLALLAITAAVLLLWQIRVTIALVFVAAIVAAGMYRATHLLESRSVPRTASVLIAYGALVAGLVVFLIFLVPPLVSQASSFIGSLPDLIDRLEKAAGGVMDAFGAGGSGRDLISNLFSSLKPNGLDGVLAVPLTLLGIVANTAIVVVVSALLLLERDAIWRYSLNFIPADDRDEARRLAIDALGKLGAYIRGQLIIMTITGIWAIAGMVFLGIPFALPLGFFAFLTEAIPILGPFLGGGLIVAVALATVTPFDALLIFVWFLAIEQLEGWVLIPIVHGNVLKVSPVVALLAVVIGGTLFGVLGAIIALPATAVADVTLREVVLPLRGSRAARRQAIERRNSRSQPDPEGEARGAEPA